MRKFVFIVLCNFYLFSIEISPPVRINPDTIEGSSLGITVDLTGKVWVFWGGIYARYFENEKWAQIEKVLPESLNPWTETFVGPMVDKFNRLWFFLGNDFEIFGRYYDGIQWSDIIYVPVFPSANFFPKITFDSSGNLWVAWTTDWWAPYPIYTRYYDGSNWSDTMCVVKDTMGDHVTSSFFTDKYGRIWNLFNVYGYTTMVASKIYKNGVWGDSFVFWKEPSYWNKWWVKGSMIETSNEFVVLVNRDSSNISQVYGISFSSLPDTSITKIWEDSISTGYITFSLSTDKKSRVWAFWCIDEGWNGSIEKIYFSLYNGSEWSSPEIIMDTSDNVWGGVETVYDPFRNRIWLTWTSRIEGIWGVYVSYIDVNQLSMPENVQFYIDPSIFKNRTSIMCRIKEKNILSIYVFNAIGQRVKTVISNQLLAPGFYSFSLEAKNFSSGSYFIYFKTKTLRKTLKIILIK